MICNWADCTRTDTRPYVVGWRCSEHTPAAVEGREEPPTDQLVPIPRRRRSYASEYRKLHEKAPKRQPKGEK